jgi:hypothetical protein
MDPTPDLHQMASRFQRNPNLRLLQNTSVADAHQDNDERSAAVDEPRTMVWVYDPLTDRFVQVPRPS